MGIIVKSINKQGNKIIDYSCELNSIPLTLTKEEIIEKIKAKEVDNARIQIYKDQTLIRVNLDKAEAKQRKTKSTDLKNTTTSNNISSNELMVEIAKEFNIKIIKPYLNRFFEKNPSLNEKVYTDENMDDKIRDMKLMAKFWLLVAKKQTELANIKIQETISNLEYKKYCLDNDLEE